MNIDGKDWEGDERRESKRRDNSDRRILERRKRYWSSLILPILVGVIATAIVSWGAYVTHVTYGISARYEESFVKHISAELKKDALNEHRLEMIQADHNSRMTRLQDDMTTGFKDIREFQHDIYSILIKQKAEAEAGAEEG